MIPEGKGWIIWVIKDVEPNGDPAGIAQRLKDNDISWISLKIANGIYPSGIDENGIDKAALLTQECHSRGIQVYGWAYETAENPMLEAKVAADRVKLLNLDGFMADLEQEYKLPTPPSVADLYSKTLRALLSGAEIGLLSYRYPSYHSDFPWEIRKYYDYDCPQVYWEGSHNPGTQVYTSYDEFQQFPIRLPYVPIGSSYKRSTWWTTEFDIFEFCQASERLGVKGIGLYELGRTDLYVPNCFPVFSNFKWPYPIPPLPPEPEKGFLEELIMIDAKHEVITLPQKILPGPQVLEVTVPDNEYWLLFWLGFTTNYPISQVVLSIVLPDGKAVTPYASSYTLGKHNWLKVPAIMPLPVNTTIRANYVGVLTEVNQFVNLRYYVQKSNLS